MEVVGSTVLPVVFPPDDKARNTSVRVVRGLPYALSLRASFIRSRSSVLLLRDGKGFQPSPARGPVGAVPAAERGHEAFLGPVLCNENR